MACHVISQSMSSSSFVPRRILYVGVLDLNRGFQHFSDAGDDIGRHKGLVLALAIIALETHICHGYIAIV